MLLAIVANINGVAIKMIIGCAIHSNISFITGKLSIKLMEIEGMASMTNDCKIVLKLNFSLRVVLLNTFIAKCNLKIDSKQIV